MKILHLLCSNQFSGAENVACQIIHMMKDDAEYEMAYCSPDGQIRQALKERNVTFLPLRKMSICEVRRILKEYKPDVVHAHDMRASFMAALCCGSTTLISHIHNNNFNSQKPTLKAVLYRLAAVKAKHIFWVSKSAQEGYFFHKQLEEKSSVLYNVIDIEQLRNKAEQAACQDVYDIVYLGRLTYQKNPQRLISVLEKVVEIKPDVQAAIIGKGDLEEEVRKMIVEKDLQENVHCLGFMDNPYGILRNAKVMLMTSRWEGLPMCALEAMALGVPIVSTSTDGMRELVVAGETGYLCDEDIQIVQHLADVIADKNLFGYISENSRENGQLINAKECYKAAIMSVYGIAT